MSIAENIKFVREQIADAAKAAGRRPEEIALLGASKMNDAAACREAITAGVDVLGENRVQEMQQKLKENAYAGTPLHFIGHLQRNKVKQVVGYVNLIQSVSSLELLNEIEKVAANKNLVQDILLEINIGREEAKSGFLPEAVEEAAEEALKCPHVRVRGLMTIPPAETASGENLRYFEAVRSIFVDINSKLFHNKLAYLSMGMSGDFQEAIRAGSTMVRVGTAIFGARNYQTETK